MISFLSFWWLFMLKLFSKEKLKWITLKESLISYKWMHIISLLLIFLYRTLVIAPLLYMLVKSWISNEASSIAYIFESVKIIVWLIHLYFTSKYYQFWYKFAVILIFILAINQFMFIAETWYDHLKLIIGLTYVIAAWFIQITQNKIFVN